MKAVVIPQFGPPEVLALAEKPVPEPGVGEAVIEVHAASLNPVDTKVRGGKFRAPLALLVTPGYDVSGVVSAIGPGVTGLKVGDAVLAFCSLLRDGAMAAYVCLDARAVAIKPETLDHALAAALPVAGITAWDALVRACGVTADDTVLIQAGGGGVGHVAIQVARHFGARVLATASSPASVALCERCGADVVINHREHDVAERVKRLTDGRGCTVACDFVGGAVFKSCIDALAVNGRLATIVGVPAESDLAPLFLRNATLHTVFIGSVYLYGLDPSPHAEALRRLLRLVETGGVRPHVSAELPFTLDAVRDAHRAQEAGHVTGKQVFRLK